MYKFMITLLFGFLSFSTFAQAENLAVKGYDVVAYFTLSTPTEGQSQFQTDYQGKTYQFANQAHLALFQAEPAKYVPEYGGYCAFAMSKGQKAPIDPTAWRIVDGKLYLNYNQRVQEMWVADIPGHIQAADGHWQKLK